MSTFTVFHSQGVGIAPKMESFCLCENCGKKIHYTKHTGFNPSLKGKTFKRVKTGEYFYICYNCYNNAKEVQK